MKRSIAVAASALVLAAACASTATASVVPAFTATAGADQTVLLDGSASTCDFGPCGYTWRWFDGSRLGVTLGADAVISYRFPMPGFQTVVLKVSEHCFAGSASWCWRTVAQQVFVPDAAAAPDPAVTPAPVVTPDPAVTPDPVVTPDPAATPAPIVTEPPAPAPAPDPAPVTNSGSSGPGSGGA